MGEVKGELLAGDVSVADGAVVGAAPGAVVGDGVPLHALATIATTDASIATEWLN
jgi:hypothetical protein